MINVRKNWNTYPCPILLKSNNFWWWITQVRLCEFNKINKVNMREAGLGDKTTQMSDLSPIKMNSWGTFDSRHYLLCMYQHTSYLSQTPETCLCKKKLPGVNFYRFNAKNWRFSVQVSFSKKFDCVKKKDKYEVCMLYQLCKSQIKL